MSNLFVWSVPYFLIFRELFDRTGQISRSLPLPRHMSLSGRFLTGFVAHSYPHVFLSVSEYLLQPPLIVVCAVVVLLCHCRQVVYPSLDQAWLLRILQAHVQNNFVRVRALEMDKVVG